MHINKFFSNIIFSLESILFPILFCSYALEKIFQLSMLYPHSVFCFNKIIKGTASIQDVTSISSFCTELILIFFNLLVAWGLIARRNIRYKSERLNEIAVPFIVTFFYLFFNYLPYLPKNLNFLFIPLRFLPWLSLIGALLAFIGYTISAIATYSLRRSYGIFIEVGDVVTHGLYRHIRHPIYLGYILGAIGLCFLNPYFPYLMLTIIFIGLTIYRAMLEEEKIEKFSPKYRDYVRKTPFLFPLIFKR